MSDAGVGQRWRVGRRNPNNVYIQWTDEPRGTNQTDGDTSLGYFRLPGDAETAAAAVNAMPPAGLPATLASVDDVRRVCESAGLGRSGPDAWGGCKTAPYVEVEPDASPDGFLVHVDDQDSFDEVATVQAGARGVLLWHAIQAARSAS